MYSSTVFVTFCSAALVASTSASVTTAVSHVSLSYIASLPSTGSSDVRGHVLGITTDNDMGVIFEVNLSGFTASELATGYLYHIHDQPVPADGNCSGTLAHLDPFRRGEKPPCDPTRPRNCQVGDLAGKHGSITTAPFKAQYIDPFVASTRGVGAFFGNRSLVIHSSDGIRLTCSNFTLSNGTATTTSPLTLYTGGAQPQSEATVIYLFAVSLFVTVAIVAGMA